ncbi:homeobox protein CDX-1-like [Nilaparvata lugens]|uniref:homeobox protein CDX-1-like n=1 Tax=Nilaparvata lugens TaxID=108931 RepID=UPI00193CAD0A|nr:homeobox protein CDX-1-like [Nilaparvata lugens]
MVSYYSIGTMYHHGQQPTSTWYPPSYRHQPQQQFLSCMHDIGAEQAPQWMGTSHAHTHTHHHPPPHMPAPHMFPQEWTPPPGAGGCQEPPSIMDPHHQHHHHLLPSPPITEMSSPGPPASGLTPPATLNPQRGSATPPQGRSPFDWMKKSTSVYHTQPTPGKTRTKDKYRVVYTDHQRLELEKEFHYSRYITIRRKAELAISLGLSERQVKIWFQNRRAKERKQMKKREELIHKEKIQQLSLL